MRINNYLSIIAVTTGIAICSFTACGKDDNSTDATTALTTNEETTATEETTTPPVTTEAITTEPETTDPTQAWIDTIYSYVMAGDWENVYKTAGQIDNIQSICAEYQDKDWSMDFRPYEFAYLMTTSEGKHLGIVLYRYMDYVENSDYDEVNIFSSENVDRDYGLKDTAYGDTGMSYSIDKSGNFELTSTYINNHLHRYDSDYDGDLEEDEGINAWHA